MNEKRKINIKQSVLVRKGRETSLSNGHHWVFSGALEDMKGSPVDGDLVNVFSKAGDFLGIGFYGEKSIAVRMLSFNQIDDLLAFYLEAIKRAISLRSKNNIISNDTNCYRLFHSEGDFIPGLTIDVYNKTLVIQAHHKGIINHLEFIKESLLEILPGTETIVLLNECEKEGKKEVIFGTRLETKIVENGIEFNLDIFKGQKTGFFLDQRDNRFFLRELSRGKSVLNLFCYSGGFSLNALKGSAKEVVSVDASAHALELLEENLKLNNLDSKHEAIRADCSEFLKGEKRSFDIVIQDPPALVKKKHDLKNGLSYYKALTSLSLNRVHEGGLLMSYSCSQFVTSEMLLLESLRAAKKEGKKLQILKKLYQAPCHPINPCHPESEYLKGFLFRVNQI